MKHAKPARTPAAKRSRGGRIKFIMLIALLLAVLAAGCLLLAGRGKGDLSGNRIAAKYDKLWPLILVNAENPIERGYQPDLVSIGGGQYVDARMAGALEAMLDDARAQGLSPKVCSSFRTWEKQQQLYENKVQRMQAAGMSYDEAWQEARHEVAYPGTSEHHTGLAVDIVAESYQLLDDAQADTPEMRWLVANAHRYGFILRYTREKMHLTGVIYEPWHFRYVGEEAAAEIYERGICFEEYMAER